MITQRATEDKDRDTRLMRRAHQILTSFHGEDRFEFAVAEGPRLTQLRFPNHTTRDCPELRQKLAALGVEAVDAQPLAEA